MTYCLESSLASVSEKRTVPYPHLRHALETLKSKTKHQPNGFPFQSVTNTLKEQHLPLFGNKMDDAIACYYEAAERNRVIKIIGRGPLYNWKLYLSEWETEDAELKGRKRSIEPVME